MSNLISKTIQTAITCTVLLCALSGCASDPNQSSHVDPYETTNRDIFEFNQTLDKLALKPAGTIYDTIIPKSINHAVSNFFENLAEPANMMNDLLQGEGEMFINDFGRLVINSTIGLAGFADVAKNFNLHKHDQSFAVTLARYGCVDSPYLMLPFFGPSSVCNLFAMPIDALTKGFWFFVLPVKTRNIMYTVKVVNKRAATLKYSDLVDEAIDPYVFVRNAYLQHNKSLVNNNISDSEQTQPDYSIYVIDASKAPKSKKHHKSATKNNKTHNTHKEK